MPEQVVCPRCKGTGKIKERLNPLSAAMVEVKCPECKGTGKIEK
jgi:DnaJ-class molecular chaperone